MIKRFAHFNESRSKFYEMISSNQFIKEVLGSSQDGWWTGPDPDEYVNHLDGLTMNELKFGLDFIRNNWSDFTKNEIDRLYEIEEIEEIEEVDHIGYPITGSYLVPSYLHIVNSFKIYKIKDEWYYIHTYANHFYKCDQFEGLIGFLNNYFYGTGVNEALLASQYRPYMKHFDRERYAEIFKQHSDHDRNFNRIYIPIIKSKSETQSQIETLLDKHGYEVVDYMAGRAKFKNAKNVTRIGQVLQRISRNAESKIDVNSAIELSKKFVEDSNRKAGNDLMVCISRHPYDIAGSDTDRNWSNCLTMARPDTKRYKDYIANLKREISKIDLRKLGAQIDAILEEGDIDIEKVDLDLFVGIEEFKKSIVDELDANDIHIDVDLYVRYEDEDGLVDTDNDEFNALADKYNYIIDMIQDIDKFIYHGSNVSYIKTHVKAGVLLTYLIREDDRNINDPIANLDIKPYFNIFDPSDIFLYPDTRMYGHGTSDYRNTVMNWVKGVNKGKMGIYRLMDGIYNDNLQNKTLLVCENGYVIDENTKQGARGYETDKKTLKLYSDIMKDIKSDEEAEIYIQYVLKNIGDMSICGDLQPDIMMSTPKKWEQYYKKTRKRIYGWL